MSASQPVDELIGHLAGDLRPVKRLRPPLLRAAAWLGAVVALALLLLPYTDLHALAQRLMAVPDMWLAVLGSLLTAVLGAIAVFELSLPDRRPAWALLPLPGLALWIGASGMGCMRSWLVPGTQEATLDDTRACFTVIVGLSVPLSILLVLLVRRACPLRPNLTALVGGLTVAAAAATLLNFAHPYDASATDLLVHVAAVGVVVGANRLFGARLFGDPARRLDPK